MNKKIAIVFFFVTGIFLLIYSLKNVVFKDILTVSNSVENDTILVKSYLEKGDRLRGSNQDSCIFYYNNAIEKSQKLVQNKASIHLMSLAYVGKAALHCNLGDYFESNKNIQKALTLSDKYDDIDIKAQAINVKGLLFYNQNNYDSAVICYEVAMNFAKSANNKKLQGKLHTNMAIINYLQGKSDAAIGSFANTLAIAEELQDIDLITGTYINMGLVASNFGEYEKAIGFYEKAIDNYKVIDGKDGLILCYQNLGNVYLSLGNYENALKTINLSKQLAEEIGDKSNTAKAHHNLAEIYTRVGDFHQAMEEYLISIRLKEGLNDKSTLADGYNGLGSLYYQQNIYEKAMDYYQKSLVIYEELNLSRGKATSYSNIAHVFAAEQRFSEALKFYLDALKISVDVGNNSGIADQHISIGGIYAKLKQFGKAEDYLLKALQSKIELDEREGISVAYLELANAKSNEAKNSGAGNKNSLYKEALDYGLNSYKMAEELSSIPVMNLASNTLKNAYSEIGQYSEALKFAEIFIATSDSINNNAKAEAIMYAEARWSVEKQQKMIEMLQNQKILQDEILTAKFKESKQQRITIYFGIGLLLMTIAFAISSAVYNRKRRDLLYQKQLNNLNQLKMQNIRNRISPHFIFNMLGSISHSVTNPDRAKSKIENLSMLLRNVLENIENTAIPLSGELSIVENFIELQRDKFSTAFNFEMKIEADVNREMLVPAMIIQIPVENAIKHGLIPKEQGNSELIISAKNKDNGTLISVVDNGLGLKKQIGKTSGTGTGLKMVMQTIQFLNSKNKSQIDFLIRDNYDTMGTVAEIFIPSGYSFQL